MSVKAILAGQGSGGTETFEAIYGTTTSAEIEAAYQKGQNLIGKYQNEIFYFAMRVSATDHLFTITISNSSGDSIEYIRCVNNTWSYGSKTTAPLDSPALTGTPTAPTAIAGTNTTQLATTAFVQAAVKVVNDRLTYGDTDLTAGTSALTTGVFYAYYT